MSIEKLDNALKDAVEALESVQKDWRENPKEGVEYIQDKINTLEWVLSEGKIDNPLSIQIINLEIEALRREIS